MTDSPRRAGSAEGADFLWTSVQKSSEVTERGSARAGVRLTSLQSVGRIHGPADRPSRQRILTIGAAAQPCQQRVHARIRQEQQVADTALWRFDPPPRRGARYRIVEAVAG